MLNHLLLFVLCVCGIELIIRSHLGNSSQVILRTSKKATKVIASSSISDHWKEMVFPYYALQMLKHSFWILLVLLVILGISFGLTYFDRDFLQHAVSIIGIVESVGFCFFYIWIRKRVT